MKSMATVSAAAFALGLGLAACGEGGGSDITMPPPTDFNMKAGVTNMVMHGLSANVSLSGNVVVNGASTSFAGSGTYSLAAGTSATFNGTAALMQTQSIAGSIDVAGQSAPLNVSASGYYASSDSAFLGETDGSGNEYDVAQTPIEYPTSIVGGSGGTLGTVNRYTDSTMSVPLGTSQISYSATAPADSGGPIGIAVTTKTFDNQNNLTETDVTNYTMSSANVISFSSASAQTSSGTLTVQAN
ncbi:MAG TPA: hypothetical protein VMT29_06305 [Steroidobacteraceae bacterium]|nr:hypothetical protein [Steroidobacteraceae bacterium]